MNKNEPKYYESITKWRSFLQEFSNTQITKKFAEIVRKKRELLANPEKPKKKERQIVLIFNESLRFNASREAMNSNRRISNWTSAKPSVNVFPKGHYQTNDEGRYSRSCKYTKYSYTPIYTSYAILAEGGRGLVYKRGFKDELVSKFIRTPKGMIFTKDELGLLVKRLSDGMDYHPTAEDLQSKRFSTIVREKMATNFKKRLAQRQAERQNKFLEKIFQKDLKTTMVTLNDSRKAGNCVEGSLAFAERRLGISRQEILNGGHLFFVRAEKLVKTGDQKAINAAKIAWQRETAICI